MSNAKWNFTGLRPLGAAVTGILIGYMCLPTSTPSAAQPAPTSTLEGMLPSGTVLPFVGEIAPPGFLLADGNTVPKADPKYATLCNVLGEKYNIPGLDSIEVCRLPNIKGRTLMGQGGAGMAGTINLQMGKSGGAMTHQITIAEMPTHSHRTMGAWHPTNSEAKAPKPFNSNLPKYGHASLHDGGNLGSFWEYDGEPTSDVGGNQSMEILPPYVVVNFIIKL